MSYQPIDGIERDCPDFRQLDAGHHYCKFSNGCDGPLKQGMFIDDFFKYRNGAYLGVTDDFKASLLQRHAVGSVVKVDEERVRQFEEERRRAAEITVLAYRNARRAGDLGEA